MAIGAPTVHLADNGTVAGTSFSFTAASTPSAGDFCNMILRTSRTNSGAVPQSVSAFGLNWRLVTSKASPSGTVRLVVYEAFAVSPSGTSVTINLNDGGGNHTGCGIIIVSHPSAGPYVQSASGETAGAFTVQASLGSSVASGNGVGYAACGAGPTAGTYSPESGYTEASDIVAGATGANRLTYAWRADNADSNPTATNASSVAQLIVAWEIGVPPATGSVALNGQAASFRAEGPATGGAVAISGQAASFQSALAANNGALAVSGQGLDSLESEAGQVAISGQNAGSLFPAIPSAYVGGTSTQATPTTTSRTEACPISR